MFENLTADWKKRDWAIVFYVLFVFCLCLYFAVFLTVYIPIKNYEKNHFHFSPNFKSTAVC